MVVVLYNGSLTDIDLASDPKTRIYLPFILVNTKINTVINCEVSSDRMKYFFNFSQPFAIHDDNEIMRRMGMLALSSPLSIPYCEGWPREKPLGTSSRSCRLFRLSL